MIIVGEIGLSPFAKKYIRAMEETGIPYEVIHWNRSGVPKPEDETYRTYSESVDRYKSLASKVTPFLGFRRFAKKAIREQKYDKLIVLTTQTAVILADVVLGRKYKNRYYFDYRDTSYEYNPLYRRLINRIILRSYATCVSSAGFRKYLTDKKELVLAHNFQDRYYEDRVQTGAPKKKDGPIVMGYIGYLRELEYLKHLVDVFGQDERFLFHIHGGGDSVDALREYAERYPNVTVFGAYREEEKMSIVDSFDIIAYNYPHSFVNYPAVANKFYDGMIRKKPMFGNSRTYSGELVQSNGLGISLDEEETGIAQKVYDYYMTFDRAEFDRNCEKFLAGVLRDEERYTQTIRQFLESK